MRQSGDLRVIYDNLEIVGEGAAPPKPLRFSVTLKEDVFYRKLAIHKSGLCKSIGATANTLNPGAI
jgi:hypothetical protein